MKILLTISFFILNAALVSGCSSSNAPGCSEVTVQQLVKQIIDKEFRQQSFMRLLGGTMVAPPSYEVWKNNPPADHQSIQNVVMEVDEIADNFVYELTAIRTNNINNEIMKTECASTVEFGENTYDITYSAQYTDDNQIYVEVFGL
ncbi:MAG: hypothetical protein ABW092_18500 [Candidatus Thiodiazotropha sp.]